MKKVIFLLFASISFLAAPAQEQTPQETARNFMRAADWDNAILVLNRALQGDGKNLELLDTDRKKTESCFHFTTVDPLFQLLKAPDPSDKVDPGVGAGIRYAQDFMKYQLL